MPTLSEARHAQMFPRLSEAQIARVVPLGQRRAVHPGEILFEQGDPNAPFFVVLSGSVEVVRPIDGREEPIVLHEAGDFSGEISLLSGRSSQLRGRRCRVYTSDARIRVVATGKP